MPAVKCGPVEAMTTARTAGSSPIAPNAAFISSQNSRDMALRFSGRFRVIVATLSATA